jgi:hypothetical protein
MSIWSRAGLSVFAVLASAVFAQDAGIDLRSGFKIDLAKDAPVALVSADLGESKATPRGGAVTLDLHASLRLKNTSSKRLRGVTLLVTAQDVTPGGKGSVAVGPGPLVQVKVDGVLFEDLSFYGENRLNSKRQLTVWELEARRDRNHFRQALEARGNDGLQHEILAAITRQANRPRVDVQVVRRGTMPKAENAPATNYEMDRQVQFSFLQMPGAPVELMAGSARVAGDEAKAPQLQIRNRDARAIRHLEIGLALRDAAGREFLAGTVPHDEILAAKGTAQMREEATLRVRNRVGTPIRIEDMAGFIQSAEYLDGGYWIPTRADMADARVAGLLPPSPEEQRLMQVYRKRGLAGLAEELKKF